MVICVQSLCVLEEEDREGQKPMGHPQHLRPPVLHPGLRPCWRKGGVWCPHFPEPPQPLPEAG